ncbi:hypothetical protein ACS0KM_003673 [Vibrio cholerae]
MNKTLTEKEALLFEIVRANSNWDFEQVLRMYNFILKLRGMDEDL